MLCVFVLQGGGEKCGVCQKTVYQQERVEAGGIPFHKICFKCTCCKMSLKSVLPALLLSGHYFCVPPPPGL